MRPDSITLAIFEKYTTEEMADVAQKMAQAQADLESVEVEKRVSDAAFNERLKKLYAEVSEHAKKYNKGGETAQIGCDIRYDHPEPGKKSYFRMDRNELVETHDMSWEEKQETIQFPLAENATPSADAEAQPPEPTMSDISAAELEKLAAAPEPKPAEEVTQICPYPGCIHFADHDGDHEFPPIDAKPADAPPEEPKKRTRKPKGGAILPDPRKPTDPPTPGAQA